MLEYQKEAEYLIELECLSTGGRQNTFKYLLVLCHLIESAGKAGRAFNCELVQLAPSAAR